MNTSNNVFYIPRHWPYTVMRTDGGTTFSFHSSKDCPGFTLEISDLRIRDTKRSRDRISALSNDLFRNFLRSKFDAIRESLTAALSKGPQDDKSREMQHLYNTRIEDWDILSIAALEGKGTGVSEFDQSPWPDSAPPRELRHLLPGGFELHLNKGILAAPTAGDDLWIVRKFSMCQIELSPSVQAEYTEKYVKKLEKLLGDSSKAMTTDTTSASTLVDQPRHEHVYTSPDDWLTILKHRRRYHLFRREDICARLVLRLLEKAPPEGLPLNDVCKETGLRADRPYDSFKRDLKPLLGEHGILRIYQGNPGKGAQAEKYMKMTNPH